MSDNIIDDAITVIAQSETAREEAMKRCDEVRRYIQHKQIDRGWHGVIDHAQLMSVSEHHMPDGTPLWSAAFVVVETGTLVHLFLASANGTYEKLPPIAVLGGTPTI